MEKNIIDLLDLEIFISVMAPSQIARYNNLLGGVQSGYFSESEIELWMELLAAHNFQIQQKFNSAVVKSKK